MQTHEFCVVMPAYVKGEPIPFTQTMQTPYDVYSLRKHLEQFDFNEYDMRIVKIKNPVLYGLAFDVPEFVGNTEGLISLIAEKFKCEATLEAVSKETNVILSIYETKPRYN